MITNTIICSMRLTSTLRAAPVPKIPVNLFTQNSCIEQTFCQKALKNFLCHVRPTSDSLWIQNLFFEHLPLYTNRRTERKRRRICDIALNAAANYTTRPVQNVMFARAAVFLSLLKNSTSCVKSWDQDSKLKRSSIVSRERITWSGGSARKNSMCQNITFWQQRR